LRCNSGEIWPIPTSASNLNWRLHLCLKSRSIQKSPTLKGLGASKNHTFVQLGKFPVIHKIKVIHSSAWGKPCLLSFAF
jgi:hypothetical protein